MMIEFRGEAAVGFGRDDSNDPGLGEGVAQPVRVESPIGEELATGQVRNQRRRSAQVVRLPRQEAEVDQVAERVGQGQDLAGYSTARSPDGLALSPRFGGI